MSNPAHKTSADELYEMMMMEYAVGTLDDAMCLLMASHLTLSPAARRHMAAYESFGGALISECCEPVAMMEHSLNAVLGQLDSCAAEAVCMMENILHDAGFQLPQPLQRHMKAVSCHTKKWHRVRGGVRLLPIPTPSCKTHHRAVLVHARPGAVIPRLRRIHREYALVLQGHLRAHQSDYGPGDLFVIDSEGTPRPIVHSNDDGLCLIVTDGPPARSAGWLDRLFPFRF